ncbi:helix-turn-helix transcriptional regulator [Mesorhizobium sp. B2-8-9]|uniref:helix-turn-helix domain-containing protein n=1 Tax=Mesorhizobium sp. B2-8-9 TaxID=2589899 RepID=UPI00112D70BA|nr:helix-turn-helix transcriptional regulator [Mesorhizobium sp. B2-8-9]TPI86437.1 helix-turn-helix transcriptional regulator [Mesorhizobium sp. B2-8-9]
MSSEKSSESETIKPKRIVDKGFLRRLEIACQNNAHCPNDYGKQKWIREQIQNKHKVRYSPEAVSKWFSGASRPTMKTMVLLASVLEVDEAWLSLGKTPDFTPTEKKRHTLWSDGSVNLLAGMIMLNGGQIAFNENEDDEVDFFSIIHGRHYSIKAAAGIQQDDKVLFVLPKNPDRLLNLGIIGSDTFSGVNVLKLPNEIIQKYGKRRGTHTELLVDRGAPGFSVGGHKLPVIRSLSDFDAATGTA